MYDANTLDEVYPLQRKLPQQQWMTGAPQAAGCIERLASRESRGVLAAGR